LPITRRPRINIDAARLRIVARRYEDSVDALDTTLEVLAKYLSSSSQ